VRLSGAHHFAQDNAVMFADRKATGTSPAAGALTVVGPAAADLENARGSRDPDFQVTPGAHRRLFTNMTPDGGVSDGRAPGVRRLPARDLDPRRSPGAPRTFRCTRGRLHQVDHTCFLTILPKLSHISFLTTAVAIADTALEVVDDEARGRGGVKNDG
jgi:hypothetical protein